MPFNVEIKARCTAPEKIRKILKQLNARFVGIDNQTDTYFNVPQGRLKLRQGNIENNLIFYNRANTSEPKSSEVILYSSQNPALLKRILSAALGVKVEVKKQREIYFIDNVKFHIDKVEGLGSFVEIEAQDTDGTYTEQELWQQCNYYMQLFGIQQHQLISFSYSDMLLEKY